MSRERRLLVKFGELIKHTPWSSLPIRAGEYRRLMQEYDAILAQPEAGPAADRGPDSPKYNKMHGRELSEAEADAVRRRLFPERHQDSTPPAQGATPRADHWRKQLAEIGGMDNDLVMVHAGAVREVINDLETAERQGDALRANYESLCRTHNQLIEAMQGEQESFEKVRAENERLRKLNAQLSKIPDRRKRARRIRDTDNTIPGNRRASAPDRRQLMK